MNVRASMSRARRAVTLVEVAVAAAVLAVFLLGIFSALAVARRAQILTRERQVASEAAHAKLDELAATPFDELVPLAGQGFTARHAFDVGYRFEDPEADGLAEATSSLPAIATAEAPLNPDDAGTAADEARFAGRLRVSDDGDGDGLPDDLDDDEVADRLELHAIVVWRGVDGAPQRLELVARRTR